MKKEIIFTDIQLDEGVLDKITSKIGGLFRGAKATGGQQAQASDSNVQNNLTQQGAAKTQSGQSAATTASKQAAGTSAAKGGGRVQPKAGIIDVRRATYGKMMLALQAAGITDEKQQKQFAEQIITNVIIPYLTVHLNARGINITDLRSRKSSLSQNAQKDQSGKPRVVTLSEARLEITKKEKGSKIDYLDQTPELQQLANDIENGKARIFTKQNDIARKYGRKLDAFIVSKDSEGKIRAYTRDSKEEATNWASDKYVEKPKQKESERELAPEEYDTPKRLDSPKKDIKPVKRDKEAQLKAIRGQDPQTQQQVTPTAPPPEIVPPSSPEAQNIVKTKIDATKPIPLFTGSASLLQRINSSIKSRAKIDINKPEVQDQFKQIIKDLVDQLKVNGITNKQIQENFDYSINILSESQINRWKVLAEIKK